MKFIVYIAVWTVIVGVVGPKAWSDKREDPRWEKVILVPISIEPQPMEGAPVRPGAEALSQRLSQAATDQAGESLTKRRFAGIVERGHASVSAVTMTGKVRLPLSLPAKVIGLNAHEREGVFATAEVTFRDASGKVLADQTITLKWNAERWLHGAHSYRRNRALDDVLADFARRGIHDALKRLALRP